MEILTDFRKMVETGMDPRRNIKIYFAHNSRLHTQDGGLFKHMAPSMQPGLSRKLILHF